MTIIAQITDIHLVEKDYQDTSGTQKDCINFCNFLRKIDPEKRIENLKLALKIAWKQKPDHIILTGDLTETGSEKQFKLLAEILLNSNIPPNKISILPGNHDSYTDINIFYNLFDNELKEYKNTSYPGTILEFNDCNLLVFSTAINQHYTRSYGKLGKQQIQILIQNLEKNKDIPIIITQHHPPFGYKFPIGQWIDGLKEKNILRELFLKYSNLYAIHGHTHLEETNSILKDSNPKVFSTKATLDSGTNVSFFEVKENILTRIKF